MDWVRDVLVRQDSDLGTLMAERMLSKVGRALSELGSETVLMKDS